MIHATPLYEIAADQIEAIVREEDMRKPHPYHLKIVTISGHEYVAGYADRDQREAEIQQIVGRVRVVKGNK
jgi:hypothetical protein